MTCTFKHSQDYRHSGRGSAHCKPLGSGRRERVGVEGGGRTQGGIGDKRDGTIGGKGGGIRDLRAAKITQCDALVICLHFVQKESLLSIFLIF